MADLMRIRGVYRFVHRDRRGRIIGAGESANLVMTLGKNFMLDTMLIGSGYTHTGPYLGLIGAVTTGPAAGDIMTSHTGWTEAAGTTYSARQAPAFVASSGGQSSPPGVTYTLNATDTINGAFLVLGTGAVATVGNTAGTLFSAGTFTAQSVSSGNTLTVTYQLTLT